MQGNAEFALYAYAPNLGHGGSATVTPSVTPERRPSNAGDISPWSQPTIELQNRYNAGQLGLTHPDHKLVEGSVFLINTTVESNDVTRRKYLSASNLKEMFSVSAEIYWAFEQGGIFAVGRIKDALKVLAKKRGAFDAKRKEFLSTAGSRTVQDFRTLLLEEQATSEANLKGMIQKEIYRVIVKVTDTSDLTKFEIPFGVGGMVPVLNAANGRLRRLQRQDRRARSWHRSEAEVNTWQYL
jgi:hypothetical protein